MNTPEKSPRSKGSPLAGSSLTDWKKAGLMGLGTSKMGSRLFGSPLGSSEVVGVLKVTLYDVKIQRKGSSGRDKRKDRVDPAASNQEPLSTSADNPLSFNYGCRIKLGKKRVTPRKLLIPLANKPTFLGSYLNFSAHSIDSQLEIEILDLDTQYVFGTLRISLKDVPFVHDSIPFGPSSYWKWRPKRHSSIKGSLRVGLKLSKHKTAIRRVGEWRGKTAGGCLDHPTWINNPQYFLSVSVVAVLSFKLRSPLGKENFIGFYAIKVAEINELVVKRKARDDDIVKLGEHQQWMAKGSDDLIKDIYLQAGCYIIIPCTKYPNVEGSFELTILGDYDTGIKLDSFEEQSKKEPTLSDSDWLSSEEDNSSGDTYKTSSESDTRESAETNRVLDESVQKKRQANLMRAASIGNVNKLKHTIEKGGNAAFKDKAGASALTLAARNGHYDCVKLLLSKGADVNSMDGDGYNAVLMAAGGGHANTLKVLLDGGGDLKSRDPKGNTPLFLAAASGSLECVNELLEKGASVNDTNNTKQTPLMRAAEAGHVPIVKRLAKKAGAKVNVKDASGQTPLHYACSSGSLECVTFLISQFQELKVDVMEKDRNGETALHKAALRGHVDILRLFMERADKSTNGLTQAITSKRARSKNWETISLLTSREKERKKNGLLQQLRADLPKSSPARKKILNVLIIINKHGERHSAYQLISVDGAALSSNLILEEAPSAKDKSDSKKKSKKDSKSKKKDSKKKPGKSKDGEDGGEEQDELVRVVAAGQLSVLCLLIERGHIPDTISTTSLVYDIIPRSEFERLFMSCIDVLSSGEGEEREGTRESGEDGNKKEEDGDSDSAADNVKQLWLALLNAPMGAFMTTLDSVEKVNLTIVNCTETQPPNVTDIRGVTELSSFASTGTLNMVGLLVNTRHLAYMASISPKPKLAGSPAISEEQVEKNKLFVWLKEGKNLTNAEGAKEKRPIDAMCEIKCGSCKYKSSVKKKELNPKWFERFSFDLQEEELEEEHAEVSLYDKEKPGDCLGKVSIPLSSVRSKPVAKWYKFTPKKPGEKPSPGELSLEVHTTFVTK